MPTTTISNRDVLELYSALTALDGYSKAVGDRVVTVPYEIEPRARLDIALNKATLRPVKEAIEETRNAIVTEIAGDRGEIPDTVTDGLGKVSTNPEAITFQRRWREVLDATVTVDLRRLPVKSLHIGDDADTKANPIPGTVLEILMPILDHPEHSR
ncbi:MAG: hypothetical protein FGM24_04370 [Candidatus Kapabacteria bacterium]|nr:hypothetical protein [Candidatus Kapabacteria bacterium]